MVEDIHRLQDLAIVSFYVYRRTCTPLTNIGRSCSSARICPRVRFPLSTPQSQVNSDGLPEELKS